MNATDEMILDILRADGRASFADIGRRVGLSTTAAAARVHRMERDGLILGYRALLAEDLPDPTAAIEAYVDVRLDAERDSDDFLAWTAGVGSVRDAVHLTGPFDYLLHVRVRDMKALDALLRRLKKQGGAALTRTRVALRG